MIQRIRSALTCGAETLCLIVKEEEKLKKLKRKAIRRVGEDYRRTSNADVDRIHVNINV